MGFIMEGILRLLISAVTTEYARDAVSDIMIKALIFTVSVALLVTIIKGICNFVNRHKGVIIPVLMGSNALFVWLWLQAK